MMANPPESTTLPLFQWKNAAGVIVDLDTGVTPLPRKITEYYVDPDKWTDQNVGTTVNEILYKNAVQSQLDCEACGKTASQDAYDGCYGQICVDAFRDDLISNVESMIEIRDAAPLGKGVFATQAIAKGTQLGEYLGELLPLDLPADYTDAYQFLLDDTCIITAKEVGNWTRFMNHHCNPNVEVDNSLLGCRTIIYFEAARDISQGEQLFISYGEAYFRLFNIMCKCSALADEHRPGQGQEGDAKGKTTS